MSFVVFCFADAVVANNLNTFEALWGESQTTMIEVVNRLFVPL